MSGWAAFEKLMLVWLALTVIVILGYQFFVGRKLRFSEEEELGSVYNLEVSIMVDDAGRRVVGLNVYSRQEPTVYAFLTPAEARLLAGWLRLAASPGKTLADARSRMPKASA
jgi:hypothetical protein